MLDCAGEFSLADDLGGRFGYLPAHDLLEAAAAEFAPGRLALVSSFGAESAVLLHMVSRINPALPVIFLDTGKLFAETLAYRDLLVARFGLTDVRSICPDPALLAEYDPDDSLLESDPDLCCAIRKTMPLDKALEGADAWITGRKRAQGGLRGNLRAIETGPDGRIVINPLHDWTRTDIEAYFDRHDLPRHPLEQQGYNSVGCATCTFRTASDAAPRAGRWGGTGKTECGIHLPRAYQISG